MRSVWLVGWLGLLACGDNGDDRPDIDVSRTNLCHQIAEVACYDLYSCCAEAEIEDRLGIQESRPKWECIEDVDILCQRNSIDLRFALSAGTVALDGDAMSACLASLLAPSETCTFVGEQRPWEVACKDIMTTALIGNVTTGGECWIDEECTGTNGTDGYCAVNLQCATRPGPGMPCLNVECAKGAFCRNGTCAAKQAVGAACAGNQECQDELFCDFSAPTPQCKVPRDIGQMCMDPFSCKSKNCRPSVCIGTGQTCFSNAQCSGHCADDNSFCAGPGDCAPGTCSDNQQQCFSDFQCNNGVCDFPIQCTPGACMGPAICAPPRVSVNYCGDALNELPLF